KREVSEIVKISDRMNNILGILTVIIALGIQGWISIFRIATDDITLLSQTWYFVGIVLFITGSALLAETNINQLFAIYHRINYAIAMIGLVGLSIPLVFLGYLESLLFPRPTVVYLLILDFSWIFFLGLLLKRFKTKANTTSATN
ncbi:MAG: hypothetical protein ACTSYJ_06765, partial [Candidatus Thorarchaeota archaeon]